MYASVMNENRNGQNNSSIKQGSVLKSINTKRAISDIPVIKTSFHSFVLLYVLYKYSNKD